MSNMAQNQLSTEKTSFSQNQNDLTWKKLYTKQLDNLQNKAFDVFLENIKKFNLPIDSVPTLPEVSKRLMNATGWQVAPVSGLIEYKAYFAMLAERKFPTATFIRLEDEENLCKDPDIFHEIFGHCTMLLSKEYADFMEKFAKFALTVNEEDRALFARLIWFTTETGLINTDEGIKIYGSSIISSYAESIYCLESDKPIRKPFDIVSIFREPYRADILQSVYYVIDDIRQIFDLINNISSLYDALQLARQLGEYPALFPIEHTKYSNIGHCTACKQITKATV